MAASRLIPILTALLLVLDGRTAAAQRWTAVDVGSGHTCAMDSAGRAFCWGINHYGQLGSQTPETCGHAHHDGDNPCYPSPSPQPVAVAGEVRFRAVSAGGTRSCGLDEAGGAWCWGRGVGKAKAGCASGVVCSFQPVRFAPELVFRSLSVGEDGICGITTAGAGHCWRPVWRQMGRWAATAVAPGERLARVDQYADWLNHDEQLICAVAEDGGALCQGTNVFGQLGAGDTLPREGAVRVASAARFARVAPWTAWACGLATDGAAHCWGAAESRPSWPGGAPSQPGYFACRTSAWCSAPRQVAPGLRFAALAYVRDRACGLTPDGEVHCWGMDGAPSRIAGDARFTALAGGETHACGLTREGAIWCWEQGSGTDRVQLVRAPDPPRQESSTVIPSHQGSWPDTAPTTNVCLLAMCSGPILRVLERSLPLPPSPSTSPTKISNGEA